MSETITVNLTLHTVLRDITGKRDRFPVTLEPGSRVSDLLHAVGLREDDAGMVVARGRLLEHDCALHDGMEIDVFPPLSGG
ncbi:MAG: MoaD/ThiS family protein [Firmicutes bacterium]|jgi:molybdopterin converting factor small subunit|nr:MoaD/ThiS family protein [Bacillota bacterium]MDH7496797.1 MoaD/ThiS family protein [Bacillota bacterium]